MSAVEGRRISLAVIDKTLQFSYSVAKIAALPRN